MPALALAGPRRVLDGPVPAPRRPRRRQIKPRHGGLRLQAVPAHVVCQRIWQRLRVEERGSRAKEMEGDFASQEESKREAVVDGERGLSVQFPPGSTARLCASRMKEWLQADWGRTGWMADGMIPDGMIADGMVADGMVAGGLVADWLRINFGMIANGTPVDGRVNERFWRPGHVPGAGLGLLGLLVQRKGFIDRILCGCNFDKNQLPRSITY